MSSLKFIYSYPEEIIERLEMVSCDSDHNDESCLDGTHKSTSCYDENSYASQTYEYYRICPDEKYEGDFNDDYIEIEFEGPDFYPSLPPSQALEIVRTYRATIDQCDEIPELITDIRNSKYKKFEVHAQEVCYEKLLKSLKKNLPDLRLELSKVENDYFVFKMEF